MQLGIIWLFIVFLTCCCSSSGGVRKSRFGPDKEKPVGRLGTKLVGKLVKLTNRFGRCVINPFVCDCKTSTRTKIRRQLYEDEYDVADDEYEELIFQPRHLRKAFRRRPFRRVIVRPRQTRYRRPRRFSQRGGHHGHVGRRGHYHEERGVGLGYRYQRRGARGSQRGKSDGTQRRRERSGRSRSPTSPSLSEKELRQLLSRVTKQRQQPSTPSRPRSVRIETRGAATPSGSTVPTHDVNDASPGAGRNRAGGEDFSRGGRRFFRPSASGDSSCATKKRNYCGNVCRSRRPQPLCTCSGSKNDDGLGGESCNSQANGKPWCYVNRFQCSDGEKAKTLDSQDWSYNACCKCDPHITNRNGEGGADCKSKSNNKPYCYVKKGTCGDGRPSKELLTHDWSHQACASCECTGKTNPENGKGGSDCRSMYNGKPWCYVSKGVCSDGEPSFSVPDHDWSYSACAKCQCSGVVNLETGVGGHCAADNPKKKHWCYVLPGVCSDGVPSTAVTGAHWSYQACQKCECSGDKNDQGKGDRECRSYFGDRPWCFVKPGACSDGQPSTSMNALEWSYEACLKVTRARREDPENPKKTASEHPRSSRVKNGNPEDPPPPPDPARHGVVLMEPQGEEVSLAHKPRVAPRTEENIFRPM